MSVLIKGVEMPKNCFECPCVILDDRVCQVNLTFEDIAQYTNKRPDWCPLVDVPVPHGRWIYDDDYEYGENTYRCSVCREPYVLIEGTPKENLYNYCPNCGAKMEVEGS